MGDAVASPGPKFCPKRVQARVGEGFEEAYGSQLYGHEDAQGSELPQMLSDDSATRLTVRSFANDLPLLSVKVAFVSEYSADYVQG